MGFIFSGIFWGLVLILIGLSIIIRIVFNIDIPVFQIIIGLLLIYLGLQIVFGSSFLIPRRLDRSVIRVSKRVAGERWEREVKSVQNKDGKTYNIIFSTGNIDLSAIGEIKENVSVSINVVFASAVVWPNPNIPASIKSSTVFGKTVLPDKTVSFFGDSYSDTETERDQPVMFIEINTVFGSTEVKLR